MEFERIVIEPAYRKVAAALLERITGRTLNAGERLPPETELARQFGVNRSTVREALRELESHGLLRRARGSKRMMVTLPGHDLVAGGVSRALALHDVTVMHVWEGLTVLEPPIAEAAARRRSAADLRALNDSAARFARAATDIGPASTVTTVQAVAEFFRNLGTAADNPVLTLAHEPLLQLLEPSLRVMINRVPQARARIASAHRNLLAAVRARDAAAAASWMSKHVRDFRRGYELAGISLNQAIDADRTTAAS
jgi:GntR family transcriptional repressor for pyruvate dehydrogenase complex